jgi:hypothetical protein
MSSAAIHLVHRKPTAKRQQRLPEVRRAAPCTLVRPGRPADSEEPELQLSIIPLSHSIEIFRRIPAQAMRPALLELLDLISSPILLIENSPTGELREAVAAQPSLAMAA